MPNKYEPPFKCATAQLLSVVAGLRTAKIEVPEIVNFWHTAVPCSLGFPGVKTGEFTYTVSAGTRPGRRRRIRSSPKCNYVSVFPGQYTSMALKMSQNPHRGKTVLLGIQALVPNKGDVMVLPMREKVKVLDQAFEYANEYVLETTHCLEVEKISNGWCDVWARAVKRRAGFVEVHQWHGHWFVVYDGVAYDSDTTEHGFAPPD